MQESLIECIPNFSEARKPEVIAQIEQAISSIENIAILDKHSDLDHNRTVITFVGTPGAVEEAAFRAIEKAAELIDLDQHTGEHPRIGATDVVPFVPIRNASMQDCIDIAYRLGKRVSEKLEIPVYFYEEAALHPEYHNLENIRRGQYERLKEEIANDPRRAPDMGPSRLGKAGAIVIGARQPLIAYNVYLNTNDVAIANRIAKAIRFSSGGLRYCKAMGVLVEGQAQVSINLTNYRRTSLFRVVEMIRREASRYGVFITRSELVGMIPADALIESARWYLQLDEFDNHQILENRLGEAVPGQIPSKRESKSVVDFLDELASATPTPGGGSAAAHAAASAAALTAMVARLTVDKKGYENLQENMQGIISRSDLLRQELSELVSQDADAFTQYLAARKLPADNEEQIKRKEVEILKAQLKTAEIPLIVARKSFEIAEISYFLVSHANKNAISDAAAAAALCRAAVTTAEYNVRLNLKHLSGQENARAMLAEIDSILSETNGLHEQIQSVMKERGGI